MSLIEPCSDVDDLCALFLVSRMFSVGRPFSVVREGESF